MADRAQSRVLFDVPLSDGDRRLLRSLRVAGGWVPLITVADRQCAERIKASGYIQIARRATKPFARLTGLGQAYLDRLTRVE